VATSNNNYSTGSSPRRQELNSIKSQVVNELGITVNENISVKDAGRIGGNMVKKIISRGLGQ
jgi:hypothetical protein